MRVRLTAGVMVAAIVGMGAVAPSSALAERVAGEESGGGGPLDGSPLVVEGAGPLAGYDQELAEREARRAMVVGLVVAISVGVALLAHSAPHPHNCSRTCQRHDAWTKLPTGEIIGVGVGVGICLYGCIGAASMLRRRKQIQNVRNADSVE